MFTIQRKLRRCRVCRVGFEPEDRERICLTCREHDDDEEIVVDVLSYMGSSSIQYSKLTYGFTDDIFNTKLYK